MILTEGQNSRSEAGTDAALSGMQLIIRAKPCTPSLMVSEADAARRRAARSLLLPLSLLPFPLQSCWQPFYPPNVALLCSQEKYGEARSQLLLNRKRLLWKWLFHTLNSIHMAERATSSVLRHLPHIPPERAEHQCQHHQDFCLPSHLHLPLVWRGRLLRALQISTCSAWEKASPSTIS